MIARNKGIRNLMKLKLTVIITVFLLGFISCYKAPEYPIIPTLEFERFDKPNEVFTLGDAGNLVLRFTDGDGDLGKRNNQDSTSFIIYRNQRDTTFFSTDNVYIIPTIPKKGTTNAIDGTIEIKLSEALFNSYEAYFGFKGITVDTFTYKIYITDRANHQSNVITTPPIIVKIP
jgi:hypothetical protein